MEILNIEEKRTKTEMVLNNIIKLPSIPKIVMEILDYLNKDEVNNSKLSKLIVKDQSLVTKILAIANSPLYGLQRKVSTIDFAVMVLGVSEIRSIVSSLSMLEAIKNKSDQYLDQTHFAQHSYLVGSIAKRICEDLKIARPGEAFTAGFLHDIGISIIHKYFHSGFIKIYEYANSNDVTFLEAELNDLGMSHAEIGFRLLEKWNLPELLCDSVKNHHSPLKTEKSKKTASVVHLADYATKYLATASFHWDQSLELNMDVVKELGFSSADDVHDLLDGYKESVNNQLESMRVIG